MQMTLPSFVQVQHLLILLRTCKLLFSLAAVNTQIDSPNVWLHKKNNLRSSKFNIADNTK